MSSAPTDCRVPDPTDAKADGAFGGNHRAGYGDRLERIIATARKGWTLAAGEGLALVQEIDRLRGELALVSSEAAEAYHATDRMDDEIVRLREENRSLTRKAAETAAACGSYQDRLAILRQAPRPVIAAMIAASDDWVSEAEATAMIRAAIRAAEQEVANDAR